MEALLPAEDGVWSSADGGDDAGGARKGRAVRHAALWVYVPVWQVIPTGGLGQTP